MLFNSLEFAVFLPLVFAAYWLLASKGVKVQNLLLLIASYVFYGWWDYRFLSLIIFSSIVDFWVGKKMGAAKEEVSRRRYLYLSLFTNLGLLGFFKYYNFFIDSFVDAFTLMGQSIDPGRLSIILPVGISFYTFQTLSYSIDIYRKKLTPTADPVSFFAYVSFFPQLVAGPIERATNLLPQFMQERKFTYAAGADGMRQILWGLFKKVVIADNCAEYVNLIFADPSAYSGSTLLLAVVLFAFQIYGDFSGYSDIAIGTARLFGFKLMQNFAFPYFSRDMAEFWRRWHISLSTWFRDYLYIPLGGSRGSQAQQIRNVFIIFVVSGFWHGANWTFIIWGALNAIYFLPLLILNKNRNHLAVVANDSMLPTISEVGNMLVTFTLTVLAWIFFRADSVGQAIDYLLNIFSTTLFNTPETIPSLTLCLLLIFIIIEWWGRRGQYALERINLFSRQPIRWSVYLLLALMVVAFAGKQQEFIYFQF